MLTKFPEKQLNSLSALFEYEEKLNNWLVVISNILLLIGELMIISLLAYLSQNLTQTAILGIGLPGIIVSGLFILAGSMISKRQGARN
ncbi:MAG: hypothetical protein GF372_14685 [Candidatus Marinimicrobia bacterium]|nr:hypothetical protein [Candidatus Neomarinimicrobiota bacterium]